MSTVCCLVVANVAFQHLVDKFRHIIKKRNLYCAFFSCSWKVEFLPNQIRVKSTPHEYFQEHSLCPLGVSTAFVHDHKLIVSINTPHELGVHFRCKRTAYIYQLAFFLSIAFGVRFSQFTLDCRWRVRYIISTNETNWIFVFPCPSCHFTIIDSLKGTTFYALFLINIVKVSGTRVRLALIVPTIFTLWLSSKCSANGTLV